MLISLVLCTVGRVDEVEHFLQSLLNQIDPGSFEIILVDQNEDTRLEKILDCYRQKLKIKVVGSARGLSRARNVGLKHCEGNIIGFPDDDCLYPVETLKRVREAFKEHPEANILTGRTSNEFGAEERRWSRRKKWLTEISVWRHAISFSIFVKGPSKALSEGFNESLGVGAGTPWGAGEETDLLLRSIAAGEKIIYEPNLVIYHPIKIGGSVSDEQLARALNYSRGVGRVIKLNGCSKIRFFLSLLKSAALIVLFLIKRNARKKQLNQNILRGKIEGYQGKVYS